MAARTGKEYLDGLKDNREIWIDGKKVNLFTHKSFEGSLKPSYKEQLK